MDCVTSIFKLYQPYYNYFWLRLLQPTFKPSSDPAHQLMPLDQLINLRKQIEHINKNLLDSSKILNFGEERPEVQISTGKKLLLLDLDRTLVFMDGQEKVHVRPHLETLLANSQDHYDIYIFTAAMNDYVQMILQKIGQHRLQIKGVLSRNNCTMVKDGKGNVGAIKNLRVLTNCPSKHILLVDDNPFSYLENLCNAIPIKPYEGGQDDEELLKLEKVLDVIQGYEDVREFISSNFIGKVVHN